jgi:multiple sugar transport system substrate-binding protein
MFMFHSFKMDCLRQGLSFTLIVLLIVLLTACNSRPSASPDNSKSSSPPEAAFDSTQPVEVTLHNEWGSFPDIEKNTRFLDPLKKKYPNITLNLVQGPLDKIVAAGEPLDLVTGPAMYFSKFADLGLYFDMNGLIKKHNFDTNRVEPRVMEAAKAQGKNGEIYLLPYTTIGYALYYNKDIFDKFGVSYPKDNMNWDDTIELAKKVTRFDGMQYKGLVFQDINNLASPLSMNLVDPKSNKAAFNTDGWKKALNLMKTIVSIPGNVPDDTKARYFQWKEFAVTRNAAMYANVEFIKNLEASEGLKWDMVTYPYFKDKPGIWGQPDGRGIAVVSNSKNKDAAFKIIETVLSDEVQTAMARLGDMPSMKVQAARDQFGQDAIKTGAKNVKAYFEHEPAHWRTISKYDRTAADIIAIHSHDLYNGKDANTILREADEELNQYIVANP